MTQFAGQVSGPAPAADGSATAESQHAGVRTQGQRPASSRASRHYRRKR